jgi:hypothetical protein
MRYITIGLLIIILSGCITPSSDLPSSPTPNGNDDENELLLQSIVNILGSNNCELPCFRTLSPSVSTLSDIESFISDIDVNNIISEQIAENNRYGFSIFPSNGLFSLDFITQQQILEQIRIGITEPSSWLPQSIFDMPTLLSDLGAPDSIFMLVAGPPLQYSLVIVYNRSGVLVRYQMNLNREEEIISNKEKIPVCWNGSEVTVQQIDIWLQNAAGETLVQSNQPDLTDVREVRPWWRISEFTNLNEESFAEFFIENPDECVPSMSLDELSNAGYQY